MWRCDRGAEVVIGGSLQFHNFVALDNEHAGLEMVEVSGLFGVLDGPGECLRMGGRLWWVRHSECGVDGGREDGSTKRWRVG